MSGIPEITAYPLPTAQQLPANLARWIFFWVSRCRVDGVRRSDLRLEGSEQTAHGTGGHSRRGALFVSNE
ncbi:TPA: hypothetical protein O6X83_002826 [Staphylococcus aureus]|nr:hypothetical protein [Staphylococcus aureus]